MAEGTYTLTGEELTWIRNALRHRANDIGDEAIAEQLRELRNRLFGTESVTITYPQEG